MQAKITKFSLSPQQSTLVSGFVKFSEKLCCQYLFFAFHKFELWVTLNESVK